jgi:hypothetical protein
VKCAAATLVTPRLPAAARAAGLGSLAGPGRASHRGLRSRPSALRLGLISLKEMTTGMTKRWMAEITYRNGDAPTVVQFEELAELHDR